MRWLHIRKLQNGAFVLIDAPPQPKLSAGFAGSSGELSESQLRAELKRYNVSDGEIALRFKEVEERDETSFQVG